MRGSEILSMWKMKSPVMMKSCGVVAAVAMRMCRSVRKSEIELDLESFWMMC